MGRKKVGHDLVATHQHASVRQLCPALWLFSTFSISRISQHEAPDTPIKTFRVQLLIPLMTLRSPESAHLSDCGLSCHLDVVACLPPRIEVGPW